jgi:hypothetical protein
MQKRFLTGILLIAAILSVSLTFYETIVLGDFVIINETPEGDAE